MTTSPDQLVIGNKIHRADCRHAVNCRPIDSTNDRAAALRLIGYFGYQPCRLCRPMEARR